MPAHKHAELMMEYAKDAAETDEPWIRWECTMGMDRAWMTMTDHPSWDRGLEYRRKSDPVECWVVVAGDLILTHFHNLGVAEEFCGHGKNRRVVHMREVV